MTLQRVKSAWHLLATLGCSWHPRGLLAQSVSLKLNFPPVPTKFLALSLDQPEQQPTRRMYDEVEEKELALSVDS